jgi:NodT family efflux transporter outer membrane factor (OMF) lipoprotein
MAKSGAIYALSSGALLLAGCSFAPAYAPPAVETPGAFKEAGAMTPAADGSASRRDWWTVYGDPELDRLEADLGKANSSLASAVARYDQSRALAAQAGAALIPEVDAVGAVQANRQSKNKPLRLPAGNGPNNYDNNQIGAVVNYELDLWGRIRNTIAATTDQAQASAADLRGVELSLQAQLADNYMALRGSDAELRLLQDTVTAYSRAFDLTHTRHEGGAASGLDEDRAETQLRTAKALIPDVKAQRALYEHAIAVLVGQPASVFSIPVSDAAPAPLRTPVTAASSLLQRRPDVAAAERRAAAANAEIGVAKAAYFPTITLGLSAGFQDAGGVNLLQAPNSYWTLGPTLVAPLFDGGRRRAQTRFTEAQFAQAAADYKQTVLGAFQDVEDQLALNNLLADEADEQARAVTAAVKTQDLALTRYQLGAADYLEVTTAQTAALVIQQSALTVQTRRLQASVNLVRALGGGWTRADLPKL